MPAISPLMFRSANAKTAVEDTANHLDGFRVLLFGSVLYKNNPADIDILFVYDQTQVDSRSAFQQIRPVILRVSM